MSNRQIYNSILVEIEKMPVIDTHEHVESEDVRTKRHIDMFNTYMTHYASCDLISSGMSEGEMAFLKSDSDDLEKKWFIFKPHWENSKNTTYCKSLILATDAIYGINDINENTYQEINEAIKRENKKGFYQHVLKDICNIETSILDSDVNCDRRYFTSTMRFDNFIRFKSRDAVKREEQLYDVSVSSLSDWANLLKKAMEICKSKYGVPCIKSGLAYERTLLFERTDYSAAENVFNRIMSPNEFFGWYSYAPADSNTKPLEDYMMHILVQTAADMDLPVQFHTGLQEGNGNFITHSNPANLANLFLEYPKARFDIFHGGYPYGGELCALAKNFKNVYVDLCWANIISREYTVRLIEELLDTVPANKIFGFGGDYCFIEGICGHLIMARENIAMALSNKVDKGYMTIDESIDIARKLLYENAKNFFKV
jgi:hypothetical protein